MPAFGDAAASDALDPAETLAESAEFAEAKEALGGDYDVSFFLAFQPILALAEADGRRRGGGLPEGEAVPGAARRVVGGASKDGDKVHGAFGLTVK